MTTRRNPQFNVRIPPVLKEKVVALAEKNKRPVNAEINAALEMWVSMDFPSSPAEGLAALAQQISELNDLIEKMTKKAAERMSDEQYKKDENK